MHNPQHLQEKRNDNEDKQTNVREFFHYEYIPSLIE